MKLTQTQIKWAAQHHWFIADNRNGTITVADRYSDGRETIMVWRGTFAQLRDWAGY